MKLSLITFLAFIFVAECFCQTTDLLQGRDGSLSFVSEAPLELITAESHELEGILNRKTGQFGFQVNVNSFEGFNNPLQRIHFQENYMETGEFPKAIFEGVIIEEALLLSPGTHSIRAKGQLNIHGIAQERIIRAEITMTDDQVIVNAEFTVRLEDHDIRVPRIVYQKIAEEINISLRIELR